MAETLKFYRVCSLWLVALPSKPLFYCGRVSFARVTDCDSVSPHLLIVDHPDKLIIATHELLSPTVFDCTRMLSSVAAACHTVGHQNGERNLFDTSSISMRDDACTRQTQ